MPKAQAEETPRLPTRACPPMTEWLEGIRDDLRRRDYSEAIWRALLPLAIAASVINGIGFILAVIALPIVILVWLV